MRLGKEYLKESPELHTQIKSQDLVQWYLPKHAHLDIILKIIQTKVLKGTYLPLAVKKIQTGYLNSPYF